VCSSASPPFMRSRGRQANEIYAWRNPKAQAGSPIEKDQTRKTTGKSRVCLTKAANRPRLHRGAERSRGSG
jgi:hypothetical protein